jgi:hypothetical protein
MALQQLKRAICSLKEAYYLDRFFLIKALSDVHFLLPMPGAGLEGA